MKKLIIHCSDSPFSYHGLEAIRGWHVNERGWSDIGYHYVIERSGELKKGRKESKRGAHTLGHNSDIGLCLCGLSGKFEQSQMRSLERFIVDNYTRISEVCQHSNFEPKKPHCAGLTYSQMKYLNNLI